MLTISGLLVAATPFVIVLDNVHRLRSARAMGSEVIRKLLERTHHIDVAVARQREIDHDEVGVMSGDGVKERGFVRHHEDRLEQVSQQTMDAG